MKFTLLTIRRLSRVLLLAVLFAQGTLAAHACAGHEVNVSAMLIQAAQSNVEGDQMPCHHAEAHNVNACEMHCTQADQLQFDLQPVVASEPAVLQHVLHDVLAVSFATHVILPVHASAPPLNVQFCNFRI